MAILRWLTGTLLVCVLAGLAVWILDPQEMRENSTAEGIALFFVIGPLIFAGVGLYRSLPVGLIVYAVDWGLRRWIPTRYARHGTIFLIALSAALGHATYYVMMDPLMLAALWFIGVVPVACGVGTWIMRAGVPIRSGKAVKAIFWGSLIALATALLIVRVL